MSRGGAYYNEIDPFAAAWLRELIKAGHIAPGEVDERSIEDVTPNDLAGFVQCHFFAGIGVWSYALRRAGWPDDKPVWTGSCPCQPFSAAGKGAGFADERHLWPALYHLIGQLRPDHVFGEQVASKDGLAWLNLVQTDMENAAYTCGMVDTCAAGFGSPHIRQRLYWVSHSVPTGRPARRAEPGHGQAAGGVGSVGLADAPANRLDKGRQCVAETGGNGFVGDSTVGGLAEPEHGGCQVGDTIGQRTSAALPSGQNDMLRPGPTNGQWSDVDWLFCRDGKWRPVSPGTFPLAHGAPARVGRLRGYGNAICAAQAEEFIRAYMEVTE